MFFSSLQIVRELIEGTNYVLYFIHYNYNQFI